MISTEVVMFDAAAQEAELRVSDGKHSFLCFAHPWYPEMARDDSRYFLFGCDNIERCQGDEDIQTTRGYSHIVQGVVVKAESGEIAVGPFVFECDAPLPGDVENGEIVRLSCMRIDVF